MESKRRGALKGRSWQWIKDALLSILMKTLYDVQEQGFTPIGRMGLMWECLCLGAPHTMQLYPKRPSCVSEMPLTSPHQLLAHTERKAFNSGTLSLGKILKFICLCLLVSVRIYLLYLDSAFGRTSDCCICLPLTRACLSPPKGWKLY